MRGWHVGAPHGWHVGEPHARGPNRCRPYRGCWVLQFRGHMAYASGFQTAAKKWSIQKIRERRLCFGLLRQLHNFASRACNHCFQDSRIDRGCNRSDTAIKHPDVGNAETEKIENVILVQIDIVRFRPRNGMLIVGFKASNRVRRTVRDVSHQRFRQSPNRPFLIGHQVNRVAFRANKAGMLINSGHPLK